MATKESVQAFLTLKTIAVVGASRDKVKFGNLVYKDLKKKGYEVYPVNPKAEEVDGDRCYPNLTALPGAVAGAVLVVPPKVTETVVQEVAVLGIKRIWMQQGAESQKAIRFCEENKIDVIHGECILMFAEPAAFYHKIHRFIWRLLGKLPA